MVPVLLHLLFSIMIFYVMFDAGMFVYNTYSWIYGLAFLVISIGVLLSVFTESRKLKVMIREYQYDDSIGKTAKRMLVMVLAAYLTYKLTNDAGFYNVVASGLVSFFGAVLSKEHDADIFAASFLGMASSSLFSSDIVFIGLAIIHATLFILSSGIVYTGFGGRSGFIAAMVSTLYAMVIGYNYEAGELIPLNQYLPHLLIIVLAATVVYFTHTNIQRSSALPGSTVLLILSIFTQAFLTSFHTDATAVGAFSGVEDPSRSNKKWQFFMQTIFSFGVFILLTPIMGGYGGRLGTYAFLGSLSAYGYYQFGNRDTEHPIKAPTDSR